MSEKDVVWKTFRALVENADRKFGRVRDLPPHERGLGHYFPKVFKSYMRLWKYQQEHRARLVESGLNRWEIGEVASRIGQLYFSQYMRTSESRFLVEAYVFYEAILSRRYFEGTGARDLGVRAKELRFYARFLLVSLILNRTDMVKSLVERFKAVLDDCRVNFRETSFKEWKLVVQEIVRFMDVENAFVKVRPLRYCTVYDTHPKSLPYVTRFHAKKILKFQDAVLTSYHRNEVKFAELTLDTYRMLQCLEWEPSGLFSQKQQPVQSNENGSAVDHSGASAIIDINLGIDLTDSSLPRNPRKAILYRPSVTQLIAVIATICEELRPDTVMLIYLSAPGRTGHHHNSQVENSKLSAKLSRTKFVCEFSREQSSSTSESSVDEKNMSNDFCDGCLCLAPRGTVGSFNLYPADIIPFTRKPLFLIIDSDNSHTFKVVHGAERGETAALFLSPLRSANKNMSGAEVGESGSQFTFFLTAPLLAFCQLVGLSSSSHNEDVYKDAENILASAFSGWEVTLCTSADLDLVWAQVLSDPFIRRLILRFVFCRSVLFFFCPSGNKEQYLPVCLPCLPESLSPTSEIVRSAVVRIANHFQVAECFHFADV
ncbi:uncharacterized protein LOC115666343 [Syzygium oleosum]|uniref:uncharacterized protein LOC115666343 n=1 Tax=Syzygium oleosum TaxID=219896 RepID=UPI0024B8E30B|nr:uncharacterized protein LOC115666343 [Syzygium oleosum]